MIFQKSKLPREYDFTTENKHISDFKDGSVYQEFLKNENPNHNNDVYTFTLNTDGISLCDKSNIQVWPQYMTLNETHIESRYSPENTIISGKYYHIYL